MGGRCGRPPHSSRYELIQYLGETHKRQRKGMMPAFGITASRELLPRFVEVLDKVSARLLNFHPVARCNSNQNSSMECGKISSQILPTRQRHWTRSDGLVELLLMCGCLPHPPFLHWRADTLIESGKVRIHQGRETHTECGVFPFL